MIRPPRGNFHSDLADNVEGIGEIYEQETRILTLFNTIHLQLSNGKDHTRYSFVLPEAALAFRDHAVCYVAGGLDE